MKEIFHWIAQMQQRGSFLFQASQQPGVTPLQRDLEHQQCTEESRGWGALHMDGRRGAV